MPDNDLQKLSPAYRLPASDPDFILSGSMQGVRFLLEFAKADERLRLWGIPYDHRGLGQRPHPGSKRRRPWRSRGDEHGALV
jgi:hypothetical protein